MIGCRVSRALMRATCYADRRLSGLMTACPSKNPMPFWRHIRPSLLKSDSARRASSFCRSQIVDCGFSISSTEWRSTVISCMHKKAASATVDSIGRFSAAGEYGCKTFLSFDSQAFKDNRCRPGQASARRNAPSPASAEPGPISPRQSLAKERLTTIFAARAPVVMGPRLSPSLKLSAAQDR
jgi:hypothetical protein